MFWRNSVIEDRAEQRLIEFQALTSWHPSPPVPIEQIAEHLFDLSILWDLIEAPRGLTILGGLRVEDKQIVMNEAHTERFRGNPGLERFTIAHEVGHWDLSEAGHRVALRNPLPGLESESFKLKCRGGGDVLVTKALWNDEKAREALALYEKLVDQPAERRPVDRYAAALLMPKSLIQHTIDGMDLSTWPSLYALAHKFDVSITALRVRLEQLDRVHVGKDKSIYVGTREERDGQQRLPF